jgi:outer membrane lipase/esterase
MNASKNPNPSVTRLPVRGGLSLAVRLVSAAALAWGLAGCGGGSSTPVVAPAAYDRLVVFGDSLSDVGTYATAGVKAMGGGKFTVNGASGKVWVEDLAAQLRVAAPCAARTGLESSATLAGLAEAVVDHAGCYGYAQGGARVTDPIGPNNKALLALGDASGALGLLTEPVTSQITHHLNAATSFGAKDLVLILAGANDAFMQAGLVGASATTQAAALAAMTTAATELANQVRNQIIANGATRVVVLNLPDVSATPDLVAQGALAQGLMDSLVQTFNAQLKTELGQNTSVLLVDLYVRSQDQAAHPGTYQLSNTTTPACPAGATNPIRSLGCSAATTLRDAVTGVAVDVSHYLYADGVHPTPYGHQLIADTVYADLTAKGWPN